MGYDVDPGVEYIVRDGPDGGPGVDVDVDVGVELILAYVCVCRG